MGHLLILIGMLSVPADEASLWNPQVEEEAPASVPYVWTLRFQTGFHAAGRQDRNRRSDDRDHAWIETGGAGTAWGHGRLLHEFAWLDAVSITDSGTRCRVDPGSSTTGAAGR